MITKVYSTYVFDLDGTLIDSMPYYIDVMLRILKEEGARYPDDIIKIITPLGYGGAADYYREALGVRAPKDELVARMHAYALEAYTYRIPLKEGVLETLLTLKERGASLHVLTASPHSMLDVCLKRLGVYDLFENVWSCEDFGTTKTDPQIYHMVAKRLHIGTDEYIFVDDNLNAVQSAVTAGIHTFSVYDKSSDDSVDAIYAVAKRYLKNLCDLLHICPDPFTIDHDLHIHSELSLCSTDPMQSPDSILQYAKDNNLSTICLTDHFWDSSVDGASDWYKTQDYAHIAKALPLPQDKNVRFLFGAEAEFDKHLCVGVSPKTFEKFDFVIIPTTHMHMRGFTLSDEDYHNTERLATLWVERLDALLNLPLPFHKIGIAHLACGLIHSGGRKEYLDVLSRIPTVEMERLFAHAAALGVGIELNASDMSFADEESDTVLRIFRIARDMGCKFYLGTDAHHPKGLRKREVFVRALSLLDLCENDKFTLPESEKAI